MAPSVVVLALLLADWHHPRRNDVHCFRVRNSNQLRLYRPVIVVAPTSAAKCFIRSSPRRYDAPIPSSAATSTLSSSSSSSSTGDAENMSSNQRNCSRLITDMDDQYERLVNKLIPMLRPPAPAPLPGTDGDGCHEHWQYWVAIAGGPGSGKTTVAHDVAERLNEREPNCAIVVPMDGWHIPKDRLQKEYGTDEGLRRRGAPWTFDAQRCLDDLKRAKLLRSASLPSYSREISDPTPDGVRLETTHKIVLVEGLYLLWKDGVEWEPICQLWDEGWFVKVPTREEQIDRLIRRARTTWSDDKAALWGPWPEGARKRAEFNDVKNMDVVDPCEQYADEVIVSI